MANNNDNNDHWLLAKMLIEDALNDLDKASEKVGLGFVQSVTGFAYSLLNAGAASIAYEKPEYFSVGLATFPVWYVWYRLLKHFGRRKYEKGLKRIKALSRFDIKVPNHAGEREYLIRRLKEAQDSIVFFGKGDDKKTFQGFVNGLKLNQSMPENRQERPDYNDVWEGPELS